jgi:WD40 repeat protein
VRPPVTRILIVACLSLPFQTATASADSPRTDLYGDPLPDGAVARMGSVRLRHAGLSDYVCLPDGKTVLTTGNDRVLRFWDLATGRPTRTVRLQGKAGPGRRVTLSPDGTLLAAVDRTADIAIWEVASGKELKMLPGPRASVGFLYFSPDGKTLAVGRNDWRVSLWRWEAGKEREVTLPARQRPAVQFHMDNTFHGGFSPDGKWFVAGVSSDEPLGVFEAATGREVHRLDCHADTSTISPDGKCLAVASGQNDKGGRETVVRLFDLASGKEVAQFPQGHDDSFFSLAFSPDGKTLACSFSDRSYLLDCATGRVLHRLTDRPRSVSFTPDGKILLAVSGHQLRLWDVASGKELQDRPGDFGWHPHLALNPDGRLLAAADWEDRDVSLWDTASGRLLRRLPLGGKEQRFVGDLAFLADGRRLVACQNNGFLQFWDAASGKEQRTVQLDDPAREFYQFHVSPGGQHVSTLRVFEGDGSSRLALWEIATGKAVREQLLPWRVYRAAWRDDGKAAALPLEDGLTLMEIATGAVIVRIPDVKGDQVTASADYRLLVARRSAKDEAATVGVWESATGKEVAIVPAGCVDQLALAPDDRTLVTTDEGSLRAWDLATGKEWRRWPLPVAATALLMSPDGRRAFTALADGAGLVWDLSPALVPAEPLAKSPGPKELAAWWADLADADARRAYAAIWRLAEVPEATTVAFLRERLKPAAEMDGKKVRQLIADLDSDTFDVREKANRQLQDLGPAAVPALREALEKEPSPEVRRRLETLLSRQPGLAQLPEVLRRVRAIQVLERLGSKEARALLTELSKGAAYATETQEAKAALERLSRRAPGP